ncbi:PIG-L deacetylase family protein [Fictibacillus iocasae]|uniref:PIG-L deacetylase family protein n=1 Tax=Fictibacillus iocasae TaxID=2715437 RepID=A0ABW2NRC2_9BACL
MKGKALVIASHPDDEMLGCAGTLKKLILSGYEVVTVIVAQGRSVEVDEYLQKQALLANQSLGIQKVTFLNLPNLKLDTLPLLHIVQKIEAVVELHQPSLIFTHHYGDLNRDHQITFQAVMTAARPLPSKKPIDIFCFETVSSTEWTTHTNDRQFKPNYYVDIKETYSSKLRALRYYDLEMKPFPHPRSYRGVNYLARVRGMEAGVEMAEAFEMIRMIWK